MNHRVIAVNYLKNRLSFKKYSYILIFINYIYYEKLYVYDVLEREIEKLLNGNFTAGKHNYVWTVSGLASGIYFYQIVAAPDVRGIGNFVSVRKMVFIK